MIGIRKALVFSILTQHSVQFINLVFVVIIARIITPAEIGVFALASSIAILAAELRSLGVGPYLVREKIINDEKIRSAIGVMIIISWGLGVIIIVAAPFVSDFYSQPALKWLLWISSIGFFVAPFATVPHALLAREMKFQQILVAYLLGSLTLSISSIGLVLLDYSYYGLAIGVMLGTLTELVVINYYVPKGTPSAPSFKGILALIHFGLYLSMTQLFNRFSESISDLVIGRTGTMADVGLFSRGLGLILFLNKLIVSAVGPVILPYLSAIERSGKSVADAYLHVIVLQAAFSLPAFAIVNVAAFPIIRIMFGDQWDLAVPVASTLSIWALFQAVHNFWATALVSTGAEKMMFNASLLIFLVRTALVIGAALAYTPFDMMNVAWALVLSGIVELVVKSLTARMATGLGIRRLCKAFIPNILVTATCWGTLMLIDQAMPFEQTSPWKSMIVIALTMPPIWLLTVYLTKHELWKIISNLGAEILEKINNKKKT